MYFASSVAVAVAPGTPGIGNVTTGLPASHATDVLPAIVAPSCSSVAGFAPHSDLSFTPRIAALGAPCGLAHKRINRSCKAAGIGVALPLAGTISAPGMSSFHAYCPLTTSTFEYAWPLARVQVY